MVNIPYMDAMGKNQLPSESLCYRGKGGSFYNNFSQCPGTYRLIDL